MTPGLPRRALQPFIGVIVPIAAVLLPAPDSVAAQAPDQPLLRMLHFYEQRAYPFERVPVGALQRARNQMRARWPDVLARDAATDITATATAWSPIGPAPIGGGFSGRISTIAVHPNSPSTLYIGGAQGGVWKTTDGGATWVPLTDTQCSLAMGALAIDPVNPQILYAGTGELHFSGDSYYGCGVLRSLDGGASWTQLGAAEFDTNTGGARIARVLIDPASAGSSSATIVHAATSSGMYRSTTSGLTWTRTLDGVATDVQMDPVNPTILYAALGATSGPAANGVYKSTDRGVTWAKLSGIPATNVGRIALGLAPGSPSIIYAAIQDAFGSGGADGQLLGIWKTTDAGATWARVNATAAECGSQCWYDLFIATDPFDPAIVYFGGVLLYRSDDGGATFRNITRNIHVDQHAIAFAPGAPATVYIGNDGGIFQSPDRGANWFSLNTNLSLTQFYSGISLHPTDPNVVLGGTQDNGTLEFAGEPAWIPVLGGDGGFTAIDYIDPTRAWAETQWTPGSGFSGPRLRIGASGFSAPMVTGINTADRALFIPPLVMDPTDPDVLYFGTFRLYRTADSGDLWTPLTGDLTKGTGRVSAITPARSDPATVYVGTNDGNLHVTRDGTAFELRITGLPNRVITDIAVDGADPAVAVLTVSGFGTGHVFRTTNAGLSWADVSGSLPDVPVNAVLTHPGLGGDIYVGTDLGVFVSEDDGTSWTPFTTGLPNAAVFDLAYNSTTGFAIAASHGRGMFAFRPAIAASLVVAPDTLRFTSLQDTVRLSAVTTDTTGATTPAAAVAWRTLDGDVATVDASGLVRSIGNGNTRITASFAGVADTADVTVDQIIVAIAGLPAALALVSGERITPPVRAVDAAGQTAGNAVITWSSSDADVVTVDATGAIVAGQTGNAILVAAVGALRDSASVAVAPPSTASLAAEPTQVSGRPSSAAGSRVPFLVLDFTVSGVEQVEITRLGFDVTGDDPGAMLVVIRDVDGDGTIGTVDSVIASFAVNLRPGETRTVTLSPNGFRVPAQGSTSVIVALGLSGRAPNGATFRVVLLPELTASTGARSSAQNRLTLPGSAVASADVRTTLLDADEILTFSENPVRSSRVVFNFAEVPTTAAVYTVTGRRVIDLTRQASEEGRVEWDLRNDDGALVAPGVYLVIFNVGGTIRRERIIVLRPGDDDARAPAGRAQATLPVRG